MTDLAELAQRLPRSNSEDCRNGVEPPVSPQGSSMASWGLSEISSPLPLNRQQQEWTNTIESHHYDPINLGPDPHSSESSASNDELEGPGTRPGQYSKPTTTHHSTCGRSDHQESGSGTNRDDHRCCDDDEKGAVPCHYKAKQDDDDGDGEGTEENDEENDKGDDETNPFPHQTFDQSDIRKALASRPWPTTTRIALNRVAYEANLPFSPSSPPSDVTRAFRYESLGEDEIRLIRILPGQGQDMLDCKIEHTSLADPKSYTAISYAWGMAEDSLEILLDNCPVLITRSLHGGLEALRQPQEAVLVWADAVCINQRDKNERSRQVSLMCYIYYQATAVALWLGPNAYDSDLAMSLIEEIARHSSSSADIKTLISSSDWKRHFKALVDLFERHYWSRLWVVQEVFNGKSVQVYCGRKFLPWDIFLGVSDALTRHKADLTYHYKKKVSRKSRKFPHVLLFKGPVTIQIRSSHSFLDTLAQFRPKFVSDPLDKIYALLGVLPEQIRHHFIPDYNASPRKLYIDVVEYILQETRRVDVICHAIHYPPHETSLNLPTWVPNWSDFNHQKPISRRVDVKHNAAGMVDTEFKLLGIDRNILRLGAIYIGKVTKRGNPLGRLIRTEEVLMTFLHWWDKFQQLKNPNDEEFCRTIVLDKDLEWNSQEWVGACYHSIATAIDRRIPTYVLPENLRKYLNPSLSKNYDSGSVLDILQNMVSGRSFFISDMDYLGMGPGHLNRGDIICVPLGCQTPVILRPDGYYDREYKFIGDAYVDGFMDGEAVKLWKNGELELRDYILF
ncbi:heterokaryon incompatibility protein-domain-containing protein [Xylariales sp. PMI_506]|nr:heterokaryon incompatibility protein-domain-containing protein [Xylariales sp. PMI_506]